MARQLFDFAREVLVRLAENGEPTVRTYLADAIEAAARGGIGVLHLRSVVQATAGLPATIAIGLLSGVRHPASDLPRTEAQIYAVDRLAQSFLRAGAVPVDLLADAPYATYVAAPAPARWQRVGRLASLAMALGPDNTHPDEYAAWSDCILAALSADGGRGFAGGSRRLRRVLPRQLRPPDVQRVARGRQTFLRQRSEERFPEDPPQDRGGRHDGDGRLLSRRGVCAIARFRYRIPPRRRALCPFQPQRRRRRPDAGGKRPSRGSTAAPVPSKSTSWSRSSSTSTCCTAWNTTRPGSPPGRRRS